jgi:hypothetical protein
MQEHKKRYIIKKKCQFVCILNLGPKIVKLGLTELFK